MPDCFEIRSSEKLLEELEVAGIKEPLENFDYQLKTNYGFVFNLKNGKVIFIPNNLRAQGLLCDSQKCFDQIVKADRFPMENPERNLYDTEIERIKTINKQIEFYQQHLNTVLKFDFPEISREAAQAYLKKIIGRTIKKLTTHTDLMAVIAVFGELIRREIDGKWVIEKWYGTYNPHFKPRVLTKDDKLIFIDDDILGKIKWKISDSDMIFDGAEGVMDIKERSKHHECTII